MADETPTAAPAPDSGAPIRESIELRVESHMPDRGQMRGLWHVLDLLRQIEARITRINASVVSPGGAAAAPSVAQAAANAAAQAQANANAIRQSVQAQNATAIQSEASQHNANAAAIAKETQATQALTAARGNLISRTTTIQRNPEPEPSTKTITETRKLGAGVTESKTVTDGNEERARITRREGFVARTREELAARKAQLSQDLNKIKADAEAAKLAAKQGGSLSEVALVDARRNEALSKTLAKAASEIGDPVLAAKYRAEAEKFALRTFTDIEKANGDIARKRIADVRNNFANSVNAAVSSGDKSKIAQAQASLNDALSREWSTLAQGTSNAGTRSKFEEMANARARDAAKNRASVANIAKRQQATEEAQSYADLKAEQDAANARQAARTKARLEQEKQAEKQTGQAFTGRTADTERQRQASIDAQFAQAEAARKASASKLKQQTSDEVTAFESEQRQVADAQKRRVQSGISSAERAKQDAERRRADYQKAQQVEANERTRQEDHVWRDRKAQLERQQKQARTLGFQQADAEQQAQDTSVKKQTTRQVSGQEDRLRQEQQQRKQATAALNQAMVERQEQFGKQLNYNQFQARVAQAEADGYRLIQEKSRDTLDGMRRTEQVYEKIAEGRRRMLRLTTVSDTRRPGPLPAGAPPNTPPPPTFVGGFAQSSNDPVGGRAGRNLLENIAHVTAWMTAVRLLFASVQLAQAGIKSLIETGAQLKRLEQVFRGSSAEARMLTDDVLRLASANGRSAKEAMDAAIQWSRLGLNRAEVSEAIRVTTRAANVAELDMADATQRMIAIMVGYGLRVGELGGALSQLNAISNTYNVTNKDMLDGLSRVSTVARQAGLGFSETIGLISAARGALGQTGTNIGNALKSVIGSLNDNRVQEFLRTKFKIEVTTGDIGQTKNMSDVLAQMWVAYQKLNDAERQNLTFRVAGKNQAARFAAILDTYVKSQTLAISAQLNLNSAEQENEKILASLRAQLQSLVTEWERFVNIQGNRGPTQAISQVTQALRNVLVLMNTPLGSAVTTGMIALFTAMGVKLISTGLQMRNFGADAGFVRRSIEAVKMAAADMGNIVNSSINKFVESAPRMKAAATGTIANYRDYVAEINRLKREGFQLTAVDRAATDDQGRNVSRRTYQRGRETAQLDMTRTPSGAFQSAVMMQTQQLSLLDKLDVAWAGGARRLNEYALKTWETASASRGLSFGLRSLALGAQTASLAMVTLRSLLSIAPQLIIVSTAFSALNYAMGINARANEEAERKLSGFNDALERQRSAAHAAADAMRLLDTVSKALPSTRQADRAKLIEDVTSVAYVDKNNQPDTPRNRALAQELKELLAQNDILGVQNKLERVRQDIAMRGMMNRARELEIMDQQRVAIQNEIDLLTQKKDKTGLNKDEQTRLDEHQTKLTKITEQHTTKLVEDAGEMEEQRKTFLENDLKHLAFLEREKLLLKSISEIMGDMPTFSPMDKYVADMAALDAQVAHTDAMLKRKQEELAAPNQNTKKQTEEVEKKIIETRELLKTEKASLFAKVAPEDVEEIDKFFTHLKTKRDEVAATKLTFFDEIPTAPLTKLGKSFTETVQEWRAKLAASRGGGLVGFAEESIQQINAIETRLDELLRQRRQLRTSPETVAGGDYGRISEEVKNLEQQKRDLEKQRLAMLGERRLRDVQSENKVVLERGKIAIEGLDVGANEAEKLQSREKGLEDMLRRHIAVAQAAKDENTARREGLSALQAATALETTRLDRVRLTTNLERDRLNYIKEQQREFAKSLLMAGPAEMLRKIAVAQTTRGGNVSLGQFLAFSPEARRDAQQIAPSLDPRISEMTRQLRELGKQTTPQQDMSFFKQMSLLKEELLSRFKQITPAMLGDNKANDVISQSAKEAASALGVLQSNAMGAAAALANIPQHVAALANSAVSSAISGLKQSLGGSRGTSLGPLAGTAIGGVAAGTSYGPPGFAQ